MRWTKVVSSHIDNVSYDRKTELLFIEFDNGSVYLYKGVPRRVYKKLLKAPSKGFYFGQEIRNEYECIKVVD